MSPEEIEQRTERHRALTLETIDAMAAVRAFFDKAAILASVIDPGRREGKPSKEYIRALREGVRLGRNHSDDFIRVGNLLRRAADLIDPVLDEAERL